MSDTIPIRSGKPPVALGKEQQIEYAPVGKGDRLSFQGTSYGAVQRALFGAFGKFPIRLSKDKHMGMLTAMCCVAGEGSHPYDQIVAALRLYGEIELRDV